MSKRGVTQSVLVSHLIEQGYTPPIASALVDSFFAYIQAALLRGDTIKLSRFGNFTPRDKKARPGRNPRTHESFLVTKRRVVTFRASDILKVLLLRASSGVKA